MRQKRKSFRFWNIPSSDAFKNTLRYKSRCSCPFMGIWIEYSKNMTIIDKKKI